MLSSPPQKLALVVIAACISQSSRPGSSPAEERADPGGRAHDAISDIHQNTPWSYSEFDEAEQDRGNCVWI